MLIQHRALHNLSVSGGSLVIDDGSPFDRVSYARFKYGFTPPGVEYGRGLACLIETELFDLAGTDPITIVSAPYKHLPTASHVVAQAMHRDLTQMAIDRSIEPPILAPFHKSQMGDDSYAKSSEAERLRKLASLGLRIDESLVRGAHVLVVDDIRITGTAERTTAMYLELLEPQSIWYLHAARLPEDLGKTNPGLENELNQSASHSLLDIRQDIVKREFILNTRVLRHILESDAQQFVWFLQHAPTEVLRQMYDAALGNGLAYYSKYNNRLTELDHQLGLREGIRHHATV